VIARLLYLVPEWKSLLSETRRVLVPGGRLLHEWSHGDADEEWVQIREKIRAMFEHEGVRDPFGMFLERLVDGECSYTVPKDVAAAARDRLARVRVSARSKIVQGSDGSV